jgi:hypothetical protein
MGYDAKLAFEELIAKFLRLSNLIIDDDSKY